MNYIRKRIIMLAVQLVIMILLSYYFVELSIEKAIKVSTITIVILGIIDSIGYINKRKIH